MEITTQDRIDSSKIVSHKFHGCDFQIDILGITITGCIGQKSDPGVVITDKDRESVDSGLWFKELARTGYQDFVSENQIWIHSDNGTGVALLDKLSALAGTANRAGVAVNDYLEKHKNNARQGDYQ